jgi:hypothetical protein
VSTSTRGRALAVRGIGDQPAHPYRVLPRITASPRCSPARLATGLCCGVGVDAREFSGTTRWPTASPAHRLLIYWCHDRGPARLGRGDRRVALSSAAHRRSGVALFWRASAGHRGGERLKRGCPARRSVALLADINPGHSRSSSPSPDGRERRWMRPQMRPPRQRRGTGHHLVGTAPPRFSTGLFIVAAIAVLDAHVPAAQCRAQARSTPTDSARDCPLLTLMILSAGDDRPSLSDYHHTHKIADTPRPGHRGSVMIPTPWRRTAGCVPRPSRTLLCTRQCGRGQLVVCAETYLCGKARAVEPLRFSCPSPFHRRRATHGCATPRLVQPEPHPVTVRSRARRSQLSARVRREGSSSPAG